MKMMTEEVFGVKMLSSYFWDVRFTTEKRASSITLFNFTMYNTTLVSKTRFKALKKEQRFPLDSFTSVWVALLVHMSHLF